MQTVTKVTLGILLVSGLSAQSEVPDLKMPGNNLSFKEIGGYQNYRIIATHFRIDKNEIRYILANPVAYNAFVKHEKPMPEGSKIVKIGWSVQKMPTWPDALEADKIQRVEFMIKNSQKFNHNGDHWGYARYIKTKDGYKPWTKGTQSCISCHASVRNNDYLFTHFQKTF
ncbi:MAG TPA: cytochrome p460 [Epsilonproteobacteria bacterium]|nr:cytochrome p460 [Campylobacterota bacterium]